MQPKFTVEIVTDKRPDVTQEPAFGYGNGAIATTLNGRPKQVTVVVDGSPALILDIDSDGNLHLTNGVGSFQHLFGTTLRLKNTRPWGGKEDKS
jgi:hypothetical protein